MKKEHRMFCINSIRGAWFRAGVSLAMVGSLLGSWSPGATAEAQLRDESSRSVERELPGDGPQVGQLTVKQGDITINGNESQAGATVLSGSVIHTSSNGAAVIDLGPLGRVDLGARTTVTLVFDSALISVKSDCGRAEVSVFRGQVDLKSPKIETIEAGDNKEFRSSIEGTAPAGSHFRVECERSKLIVLVPLGLPSIALIGLRSSVEVVSSAPPTGEKPPVTPTKP
jgi:hypothetical protein